MRPAFESRFGPSFFEQLFLFRPSFLVGGVGFVDVVPPHFFYHILINV